MAAGILVVGLASGLPVFGEPQRFVKINRAFEQSLPIAQRDGPEVMGIEKEKIERVKPHRNLSAKFIGRAGTAHPVLQFRKAADSVVERYDLAVDNEGTPALLLQGLRDFGILLIQDLPVAGKQLHALFAAERQAPFALQFWLEQPTLARERLTRGSCQHGRKPGRQAGFPQHPFTGRRGRRWRVAPCAVRVDEPRRASE